MPSVLKRILNKAGYTVASRKSSYPVDLRQVTKNPLEARYLAGRKSFLLDADPALCRNLWWFPCQKGGNNPFIRTVEEYLEGTHKVYEGSSLHRFYESFQPGSVAEIFGFGERVQRDLERMPAHALVFPWDRGSMERRLIFRIRFAQQENSSRGRTLGGEHGLIWLGPVSREKGELEFNNLIALTGSIKGRGYKRSGDADGDITAFVLVRDADFRYQIAIGNHRAAVLSALGFNALTLRIENRSITRFIYRQEAAYWPNVKSGLFTEQQALTVFDTVFDGLAHNA